MHCFFAPLPEAPTTTLRLEGREAHHALRVLRLRRGEPVEVLDGQGARWRCELVEAGRRHLDLRVIAAAREPRPELALHLFQGLLKGRAFEAVVQHAVELGVRRLVPVLARRSVPHWAAGRIESKHEKWRATAIEALKQCRAAWLPEIDAPVPFDTALQAQASLDLMLVASLRGGRFIHDVFDACCASLQRLPRQVGLWIGPEGDWTDDELDRLETAGAQPITLGSHILRAETAVLTALACLSHEWGWRNRTA